MDWGFFIGTVFCQLYMEMLAGPSLSIPALVVWSSRESVLKVGVRHVLPRVSMSRKVPVRKAAL